MLFEAPPAAARAKWFAAFAGARIGHAQECRRQRRENPKVRRFETLLALLAVVLASLAALQIPGRLVFALAAIMILTFICSLRLRAMIKQKEQGGGGPTYPDAADRARQIREQRQKRFDR